MKSEQLSTVFPARTWIPEENKQKFIKIHDDFVNSITEQYKTDGNNSYFLGCSNAVYTIAYPKSACLPLKKITLAGFEFSAPNDTGKLLKLRYGDFWSLPTDMLRTRGSKPKTDWITPAVKLIQQSDMSFYNKYIVVELEKYYEKK